MLNWGSYYIIGIKVIDDQHEELFNIINKAYRRLRDMDSENSYDRVILILEELLEYSKYHFQSEESEMLNIQYPGYFDQKLEHQRLIKDLEKKLQEFHALYRHDIVRLLKYASKWLVDHILEEDIKIREFLIESDRTRRS